MREFTKYTVLHNGRVAILGLKREAEAVSVPTGVAGAGSGGAAVEFVESGGGTELALCSISKSHSRLS